MKALFHDWNDCGEDDGRIMAFRAQPEWPMPEVGEIIAIGHENVFCKAKVEEIVSDVFALVRPVSDELIPVPQGWPHDLWEEGRIEEMNRAQRYYVALKKIGDNLSPEAGTSNPPVLPWQAKIAREALTHPDGSNPWNRETRRAA